MRATGLVILSLLLVSCGPPVRESSLQEEASAKQFLNPPPTKAAIYIYRRDEFWTWPVDISVVSAVKTPLPIDSFVRVDIPAGPNEVLCKTNALPDRRRTEFLPERIRYFQVTINTGEWGPFCLVHEVPPEVGQAAVRTSRRIEPLYP
jgi:hypothetical protein